MSLKKYPVIDAQSAIHNHNKIVQGFQDISSRIRPASDKLLNNGNQEPTLDDFLRQNGVPVNFSQKAHLAKQLGMNNYGGKPNEDKQLLQALTAQESKQQETGKKETETQNKDKEFGLKNRELDIKEKEIEAKKMPGANEIADQLLSKFKE